MAKGIKTGGRVQGTPNQLTSELRKLLKNVIANELQNIPDLLGQMEAKDRAEMIIKLIPYVLPKVEPISSYKGEPFEPVEVW